MASPMTIFEIECGALFYPRPLHQTLEGAVAHIYQAIEEQKDGHWSPDGLQTYDKGYFIRIIGPEGQNYDAVIIPKEVGV